MLAIENVLFQPFDAERLRFESEGDDEIIVRQLSIFKQHFLFARHDFRHRILDEFHLAAINDVADRIADAVMVQRAGRRFMEPCRFIMVVMFVDKRNVRLVHPDKFLQADGRHEPAIASP